MTKYYEQKLKAGRAYQDFVIEQLAKKCGIIISNYSTKEDQYNNCIKRIELGEKYDPSPFLHPENKK